MNKKEFTMERVGLSVSLVCNLKCKLCAANAPYYNIIGKPENSTVSELMDGVKKFFSVVDYVDYFGITGGEPLLYRELPELMEELLRFKEQFKYMDIYSNGASVPSIELLEVLKKYGEKFRRALIDDYGEPSSKVSEAAAMFNEYQISYEIRDYYTENLHCGGWIDYGSADSPIHTKEEAENLFSKCAYPQKMKFCYSIHKGCMIPCPPVLRLWQEGIANPNDYVDLNDESLSVEDIRHKILSINNAKMLDACLYCSSGMCDDSPRFKPGEQLTSEEVLQIKQNSHKKL